MSVTTPDRSAGEVCHSWPQILPGSKEVLFTAVGVGVVVQSLEAGDPKVLVEGSNGRYLPTGHLVYAQAGTLMAVPFNLAQLEVIGDPVRVVEGARNSFSFSNDGSLVYVPAQAELPNRRLVWVDRDGTAVPLRNGPEDLLLHPRLSPDGQRIAYSIGGSDGSNVWVYDLAREVSNQLTLEGDNFDPIWTPDGDRVTFTSTRSGTLKVWWKQAEDYRGSAEQLTYGDGFHVPQSWSPDDILAFYELSESGSVDIWTLSIGKDPQPLPNAPYSEAAAAFSPNGSWLAYVADKTGVGSPETSELYVRRFPDGRDVPISSGGADEPMWSWDGRELFYRTPFADPPQLMVVDVQNPSNPGKPQVLFEDSYMEWGARSNYDVAEDGRFLMIQREPAQPVTSFKVIFNWFEELKERVPVP